MQNDHPEDDNDLPQTPSDNIFADDSDRTVIANVPPVPPATDADDDIWGAAPAEDAASPPAPEDDDRTRVMEPLPTADPAPAEEPAPEVEAPPPRRFMPRLRSPLSSGSV